MYTPTILIYPQCFTSVLNNNKYNRSLHIKTTLLDIKKYPRHVKNKRVSKKSVMCVSTAMLEVELILHSVYLQHPSSANEA